MIHERKKLLKITEEISMYFFSIGGKDQRFHIELFDGEAQITFESTYSQKHVCELERMEELLTAERNDGVEDIYWELAGSGDPGESSQLLLVGMMLDSAKVEILPDKVKIVMRKKNVR